MQTPAGAVQLYTLDPDQGPPAGTVLVIHGWTSEASFMAALAEPIRRAGYRVVLLDMPAHGLSEGSSTNLIACARAVQAIGEVIGPLAGVVAHSFGGMVALLAMEGGPPLQARLRVPRIVLVSSPNRIAQITRLFAAHWGLEPEGLRQFEKRLERLGRRALSSFTSVKLLQSCEVRALVVHAHDDDAVPFSAALEIASKVEGARLMACDGLGHRNILFAPQVARAAVAFMKEEAGERRTTLNTV